MSEIPKNPQTGEPFFELAEGGFGTGWATGPAVGWITQIPIIPGTYRHPHLDVHDDGNGELVTDAGEKVGHINYLTRHWSTFVTLRLRS